MSRFGGIRCLLGLFLEERDQVVSVLGLLQTGKGHLGARDVLFWVLEIIKQSVLIPMDSLGLVGIGVGESSDLARLAAEDSVKLRSDLVSLAGFQGVTLRTSSLEKTGAFLEITLLETHYGCLGGVLEERYRMTRT